MSKTNTTSTNPSNACTRKRENDEQKNEFTRSWVILHSMPSKSNIWHLWEFDSKAIYVNSWDAFIAKLLWHYTLTCHCCHPILHINVYGTCLLHANQSWMEGGIQLEISFGTRWRCLYWVKWGSMWSIWQGNEGREQVKWNKFFTRNQQSLTVECNYSITCTYTYTVLFCNRTYQAHTLSPPPTTTTTPLRLYRQFQNLMHSSYNAARTIH